MNDAASSSTTGRRWWRDSMVWLIIGIIGMVVGGNAVMVWVAVDARPSLVRGDYYEASKRVDAERDARAASTRLGWRVQVAKAPGATDTVRLHVSDAAGAPVPGLAGQVRAYRPSDSALDQSLALRPLAGQPGTYEAVFPRPHPGLWRLTLDLTVAGRRLYEDLVVDLPAR